MIGQAARRITGDLQQRRNLDAYAIATATLVFAMLSIVGDVVPEDLLWAALLSGVALLIHRSTISESLSHVPDSLHDRSAFADDDWKDRLSAAREVWIFAPSAVNVLSAPHCEQLRHGPLGRPGGRLNVVVLDPGQEAAVQLATRQLDDSLDYPVQDFRHSLETTLRQLRTMAGWETRGRLQWRLLDYSPGFSLVALDPGTAHGSVIVEVHAFHNQTTASRMHLTLTRRNSAHWYSYWLGQFEQIWQTARPESASPATRHRA